MVWNHSGRPMKPIGCSPNAAMNLLTMPHARRQELDDHAAHHHRGDEVGGVGDELHRLLEAPRLAVVERDRQDDRHREPGHQRVGADADGVAHDALELERLEEGDEVVEADPLAAPDAERGAVLLERQLRPVHRHVVEDDQVHQRQRHQHVELPVVRQRPAQAVGKRPPAHQRLGQGRVPGASCRHLHACGRGCHIVAAMASTRRGRRGRRAPGTKGAAIARASPSTTTCADHDAATPALQREPDDLPRASRQFVVIATDAGAAPHSSPSRDRSSQAQPPPKWNAAMAPRE